MSNPKPKRRPAQERATAKLAAFNKARAAKLAGSKRVLAKNPVPPSSKARIAEAAKRYTEFTGHEPRVDR